MAGYRLSIDGPVARITLCAPERHNALSQDTIRALTDTLGDIDADTALRVLILQAEGKSFCAGADLGNVAAQDWSENPLTSLCDRLERLRPPTICALQGGVYGGGVELAIACDFRIGVATMKMFALSARADRVT